jgi:hypothetical protein
VVSASIASSSGAIRLIPFSVMTPNSAAVTTRCVGQLGALTDQRLTHFEPHTLCLLFSRLSQDEAHARSAGGLANRLSVVAVIFSALDERFHVLLRDQPHVMAKRDQFPSPVMRTAARLQSNLGGRALSKEGGHLGTAEIDPQHRLANPVARFRQGCMLYELIPNISEHRRTPLMEKFAEAVAGTCVFPFVIMVSK